MAEGIRSYSIENDKAFQAAITKLEAKIQDLTIPLTEISKDFYKSEKSIFQLQGPGQYPDFKSEKSRQQKIREVGFAYPLLLRSGALGESVTSPTAPGSINQIVNKKLLILGTSLPYAIFHQSDRPRSKIPLRKFLFIGPEAKDVATSDQQGRLERWVGILEDFLLTNWSEEGFEAS